MSFRRLLMAVALVLVASTSATVTRASAAVVPSLEGETLFGASGPAQTTCDPAGNSTVSFTASGVASGPYPGTFSETVVYTIGPQTSVGTGPLGLDSGPVVMAHASFTIESEVGHVTGSKDLVIGTTGSATCIAGQTTNPTNPFCPDIVRLANGSASVTYEAEIQSATGDRFRDSGLAAFSSQNSLVLCTVAPTDFITDLFNEDFLLSNGVVPVTPPPPTTTPGQSEGGGQLAGVAASRGTTFGFTAYSKTDGTIRVHCNVVDEAIHITCRDATQYVQAGNQATFSGTADVNGSPTTYRIQVQDNGEPGANRDTFSIVTGSGYSAAGVLARGNIQVHP